MSTPRVTVLMSVHNGGRWLRPAIESVLAQTWSDFEFIILDDASTDDSFAQIEGFRDDRIRLIRLEDNIGLTHSLNRGLSEARGEFIARQDADDLSATDRLARQIEFLETHPEVPLVGTQARVIDAEGRSRGVRHLPLEPVAIRWLSLLDNPLIHTAAMFRTAVIRDEFGGYDESFPCCQDYALWARVLQYYPVFNLRERLVTVREHAGSVSATRHAEAREMVCRVVRKLADAWLLASPLTDAEVALLCAYRRHLAPEEVAPFHALLDRVDGEFHRQFGPTGKNEDLAGTRAGVFARIGYNLITQDRAAALDELWRAIQAWPRVLFRPPWWRIAALFVLGGWARRLSSGAR